MDFIPATTKTNRSRNDTEPQNLSRAKPGELHMEKIGASFERRGICFGWQRMDFIALSLPVNHLGPAMGETNEHKHCIDPTCPTVYCINVQNRLWSTEQAVFTCSQLPANTRPPLFCWSLFATGDFGKLHALVMLGNIPSTYVTLKVANVD